MTMGVVQIAVALAAVAARFLAAGWLLIAGVGFTFGLLPVLVLGPLVFAGFAAPPEAWWLLVLADVLLLVAALTFPDGGDNGPLVPILEDRAAATKLGDRVMRVGVVCAAGYGLALIPLLLWTLT